MSIVALMFAVFLGFAGWAGQILGVGVHADQSLVAGDNGAVKAMEDPFGPPPPRP